jgi:two-component system, OmpR family, sensor histidine kinase KdpD
MRKRVGERTQQYIVRGAAMAGTLVIVAAVTLVDYRIAHVNQTTAGFTYLVAVLLISTFLGTAEAIAGSLAAAACFNFFFLPPVLTFAIADPQNWIAWFALLTTALVASRLAAQAKERTSEALNRQQEMELLYTISRAILLAEPGESMIGRVTYDIASIFEFSSVALFDARTAKTFYAGPDDLQNGHETLDHDMRESAVSGTSLTDRETGVHIFAVRLGGQPIGSLAVKPLRVSEPALQSLSNLVAITLERKRGQDEANRREAERHSETLKSTLLDAIAHEFKTPLTSIKAAASTLVLNPATSADRVLELGSIVNEESDRLSRLVTDAIQMAHIEGGQLRMNRAQCRTADIIAAAVAQSRSVLDGHPVSVEIEPGAETIYADPELLVLGLRQLLDNAAKYSGEGSKIDVRVKPCEAGALIEIRDYGPGIPETRQDHIFEKFYRAPETSANTPGTGMGLSIVREIARAHGGHVWVDSRPTEGARFSIVLPGTAPVTAR